MTQAALEEAPAVGEVVETPAEAEAAAAADVWEKLNPCLVCQSHQIEAPEGSARTALHCFRCGYNPNQAVPLGVAVGRPVTQVTIDKAISDLRAGVVADILAALQTGQVPSVSITPAQVGEVANAATAGVTADAVVAAAQAPPPPAEG